MQNYQARILIIITIFSVGLLLSQSVSAVGISVGWPNPVSLSEEPGGSGRFENLYYGNAASDSVVGSSLLLLQKNGVDILKVGTDSHININGDIDLTGLLDIKSGNLKVNNTDICLKDGTNCPVGVDLSSWATVPASANVQLNGKWLSNDGGNEGVSVDNNGLVTLSGSIKVPTSILTNALYGSAGNNTAVAENIWLGDTNDTVRVNGGLISAGNVLAGGRISNTTSNSGQQLEPGTSAETTLRFNSQSWRLYAGGPTELKTVFKAMENGQVVFGPDGSLPSSDLRLDVEGKVGATQYCDNSGNNCKTITELSSSGPWTVSGNNVYSTNTGYVGVKTTTPVADLTVKGQVLVTGTDYARMTLGHGTDNPVSTNVWVMDNYYFPSNTTFDKLYRIYPQNNLTTNQTNWQNYFTMNPTTGNVGIGAVAAASNKLEVNGQTRITGKVLTGSANYGTNADFSMGQNCYTPNYASLPGWPKLMLQENGYGVFGFGLGCTTSANANELRLISGLGSPVSIGKVNNPQGQYIAGLNIDSNMGQMYLTPNSANGGGNVEIESYYYTATPGTPGAGFGGGLRVNEYYDPVSNGMKHTRTGPSGTFEMKEWGDWQFSTAPTGAAGSEAVNGRVVGLTIKNDGRVGIRTTGNAWNDTTKMSDGALTIWKPAGGGAIDIYGSASSNYDYEGIRLWDETIAWGGAGQHWGIWHKNANAGVSSPGAGYSDHDLNINYYNGSSYTDKLTIKANTGNVGIGTNAPSTKLDVVGGIKASGIITAGSSNRDITSSSGSIRTRYLDPVDFDFNGASGALILGAKDPNTCQTVCSNHGLICKVAEMRGVQKSCTDLGNFRMCYCD